MLRYWICHHSQPAPCERQQFFLPVISLHKIPSIQKQSLVTRVLHLCQKGNQEAKKHTRVQTAWPVITSARFIQRHSIYFLLQKQFFPSHILIISLTPTSFCLPDYSDPAHLLAHLEVDFQSPSYPSPCVVAYNDDTSPWALLRILWYKHSRQRVDCISHLLSRCLAILIAPSERLRSKKMKTSMPLPVVLVGKPHLICHTWNSLSNFHVPCVLYPVVVKGCCSHRVIKSYVPGTLTVLLTNCVHVKTTPFLLACGLAHTSVLILWQGCLKTDSLRICLVLQTKPRETRY